MSSRRHWGRYGERGQRMNNLHGIAQRSARPGGKRRAAMTLIEVMAALVILGGAVTAMLAGLCRCMNGFAASQNQVSASRVAEELLARWSLEGVRTATEGAGPVTNFPEWSWRRSVNRTEVQEGVFATQITLELVRHSPDDPRQAWRREFHWLQPEGGDSSHARR